MANSNFEYVFLFLFRTSVPTKEGEPQKEPISLTKRKKPMVKDYGMPFDGDKRLFLRESPPNAKLADWEQHLTKSWQKIWQFYAEQFGSQEVVPNYCYNALLGVTLLILDDGDSVDDHIVRVKSSEVPALEFKKAGEFLFSISDDNGNKTVHPTACYNFQPSNVKKNLCLSLQDKPQLVATEIDEFAPNSIFLVCGFSFGGDARQKNAIDKLLTTAKDGRAPLLAEVFTRLMTEQWKFKQVDEEAKSLRTKLKPLTIEYKNYANDEINCTRTSTLENHLQIMQSHQNEAYFLLSTLNGAMQTLDINAYNLATRLEQIRQLAAQNNWQIYFHKKASEKVDWLDGKKSSYDESLLAIFSLNIKNLQDHKVYLQQQLDHLVGLQDKWRLYLGKRRSLSSEHLNTLISLLIIVLAGGGASTLNRGMFGFDIKEDILPWIIAIAVIPVVWHFLGWFLKFVCCICHGTWLHKLMLCNNFAELFRSIKFFRWFKR